METNRIPAPIRFIALFSLQTIVNLFNADDPFSLRVSYYLMKGNCGPMTTDSRDPPPKAEKRKVNL